MCSTMVTVTGCDFWLVTLISKVSSTASLAPDQQHATQPVALTIYNQSFAVARSSIDLDLEGDGCNGSLTPAGHEGKSRPEGWG
jgi:hypothetical protein